MSLSSLLISEKRSFGSVFFWCKATAILGMLLLSTSWLVPNHYRPWPSFHSELMAFIAVTLLLISCLLNTSTKAMPWPKVAFFLLCVAVIPWLQLALGVIRYGGDAFVVTLYFAGLLGAVLVGYAYKEAPSGVEVSVSGLMHAIWIGALGSAAIGLFQWFSLTGELSFFITESSLGERVTGNLSQSNHLSTLLLLGLVALAFVHEQRVIGSRVLLLAASLLSAVVVLTQSRTGILGAIAIALFLLLKRKQFVSRLAAHWLVAWLALLISASQLLPVLSELLLMGGDRGVAFTDSSGRWQLWKQFLYGLVQEPWFGYGWNQSAKAQMVGAIVYQGDLPSEYAHNFVIDLLVWNGIPLGLLLIAAASYWLINRAWRSHGTAAVYAMAMLMPLLVHCLLEYPFTYGYFLLPAGLMVGVIEANLSSGATAIIKKRTVWSLMVFWFVAGSSFVYEYFLIEEDFRIVRFKEMRVGTAPADYVVPDIWISSHMAAMLKAARTQAKPNMAPEDLENLREVAERFVYVPLTYRYALALGLNGDADGATKKMVLIRGLYGENLYQLTKESLRNEAKAKFPELEAVKTP